MPDKDRMTPVTITEAKLKKAVEDCVADFDTPPDEPPGLFSNFIKWWEEQNAIAMSKEIPMMASLRDLRDLKLKDVGLLAFLGALPDDHDGDVKSVASLLGRSDSDIHLS